VQSAVAGATLSVQHTEQKRQHKENSRQPAGEFDEHVGGLSAEDIFSHASAKSGTKAFAFRPLHEDDQRHQHRDQHVDGEENVDQNVHFAEREYPQINGFVNSHCTDLSFRWRRQAKFGRPLALESSDRGSSPKRR